MRLFCQGSADFPWAASPKIEIGVSWGRPLLKSVGISPSVLCFSPSQNGFAKSLTGATGTGEPKWLEAVVLRLGTASPEGVVMEKVGAGGVGTGAGAFGLGSSAGGVPKVKGGVLISRGLLKAADRAKKFGTLVGFSDG